MADSKYKDLILETIDQLRKRKARPDLDRICHMLHRRHGLKAGDVQSELGRLVDAGIVIKVDYKGNTSYRNAAKWARLNKSLHLQMETVAMTLKLGRVAGDAVRELCSPAAKQGVSAHEVENFLQSRNTKMTRAALHLALDKEVSAKRLAKLASGNYALPDRSDKSLPGAAKGSDKHSPGKSKVVEPAAIRQSPGKRGRPLSKRKRIKKTHGPDFVENLDSPTMDHVDFYDSDDVESKCFMCCLTATSNANGEPEELLVCKDCNTKAHPSCMKFTPELAAKSQSSPWQCFDCKTCTVCEDSGDGAAMLFCDSCDKGYHMSCHKPKITEKPEGKWVCKKCSKDTSEKATEKPGEKKPTRQKAVSDVDTSTGLPTPCDSPVPSEEENMKTDEDNSSGALNNDVLKQYPEVIPDAKDWTINEVEKFFMYVGFAEQAAAFKEQEIDGKSLLLMKRTDVLTGLSIKLGPALKIYNHIKRLQTGLPDGHLF